MNIVCASLMSQNAYSRFLPADFDYARPVAVIAGRGLYPVLSVERMRQAGVTVRLIAFRGETQEALVESFTPDHRRLLRVGQLGGMLKALVEFEAGAALMAGQITPRKLFRGLYPDLKAVSLLAGLKERNAETIFGAIVREIEQRNISLLDARAFLDDQMAGPDMAPDRSSRIDPDTLAFGIRVAREIARLNIGQGVVVSKGSVLAVEAFEGTDPMLQRAGALGARDPLFVKTVKPGQDTRFDVPVFGMRTLDVMDGAGIRAAAVESGSTLILEKERVLESARKRKITLVAYPAEAASATAFQTG